MNRVIKFRVFDKTTQEMYIPGEDGTQIVIGLRDSDIGDYLSLWSEEGEICSSDQADFLQFTGLHDKNGVEIYEGDLLNYEDEGEKYGPSKVVFEEDFGIYCFDWDAPNTLFDYENLVVVGNIYENPNLLEESK